ncbi:MAG TPA: hypothetical protein VH084_29960 [Mycobacterium sp.]|jgi:hypothetical protein|nr:hypothetical protein [Mycobacterium sp.]
MPEQPVPVGGIHIRAERPSELVRGRYYPEMPPGLPGETDAQYTDRLTGADRTERRPYDHRRNRQCSIGYHDECSDPAGEECECPCHAEQMVLRYSEVHTNAEWEQQAAALDASLHRALQEKDQWHDVAKVAEERLEREQPIIAAAVKLAIRWRDWDGTENMVPWINALAEAVDRATLDAVAEAIKKGEV